MNWLLPPPPTWQKSLFVVVHTETILQLTDRMATSCPSTAPRPQRDAQYRSTRSRASALCVLQSCLWGTRPLGFMCPSPHPRNYRRKWESSAISANAGDPALSPLLRDPCHLLALAKCPQSYFPLCLCFCSSLSLENPSLHISSCPNCTDSSKPRLQLALSRFLLCSSQWLSFLKPTSGLPSICWYRGWSPGVFYPRATSQSFQQS